MIAQAQNLSMDAALLTSPGMPVYVITNGHRRGISGGAVMARYHFARGRIITIPRSTLDLIPECPAWG